MGKIKVIFKDEKILAKVDAYINKRDEIADTTATYKKEVAKLENRKKFFLSAEDIDYNKVMNCNLEIEKLTNIYKDTIKELNDEKASIIDFFFSVRGENTAETLYNTYLAKVYNGGKASRFTYVTANGKEKEVNITGWKNATFSAVYKDFLISIGFRGINSADDLNSVTDYLKSVIGAKISKKGARFIVAVNDKQFKELLVNAVIQYALDNGFYMYEKGTGLIGR